MCTLFLFIEYFKRKLKSGIISINLGENVKSMKEIEFQAIDVNYKMIFLVGLIGSLLMILFFALSGFFKYPTNPIDFIPIVLFLLITYMGLITGLQSYRGVSRYVLTDSELVVHHGLGSTKIPFEKIENVKVDSMNMYGGGRKQKGWTGDSDGNKLETSRNIWLPPLPGAKYANSISGGCAVAKLKGGNDRIALTPVDLDGFVKELSSRIS